MSPVASAARSVLDTSFLPGFLMQRLDSLALNNLAQIRKVQCLVLFVHGKEDKLVPSENLEVLKQATDYHSQYPALFVDAGHNDIESRYTTLFLSTLRTWRGAKFSVFFLRSFQNQCWSTASDALL